MTTKNVSSYCQTTPGGQLPLLITTGLDAQTGLHFDLSQEEPRDVLITWPCREPCCALGPFPSCGCCQVSWMSNEPSVVLRLIGRWSGKGDRREGTTTRRVGETLSEHFNSRNSGKMAPTLGSDSLLAFSHPISSLHY